MNGNSTAIERLQRVCSELTELHAELQKSDVERIGLRLVLETVDQLRMTALTLQQGLEWVRLAQDKHGLVALLTDERMRRAAQLSSAQRPPGKRR